MSGILQEIFIVENKAELVLPMILITILVSFGEFFINFIKLGNCCGGNPQARSLSIAHIAFNLLVFIESIITILLYFFKIEEIIIGKIFLITLIVTMILPIVISFIKDFLENLSYRIEEKKKKERKEKNIYE